MLLIPARGTVFVFICVLFVLLLGVVALGTFRGSLTEPSPSEQLKKPQAAAEREDFVALKKALKFEFKQDPKASVVSGLNLVPTASPNGILLFNEKGTLLHQWPIDATRARLLPDCKLLVVHGSHWGKKLPKWNALLTIIREYDLDGNVTWEYRSPRRAHHDIDRLENANTLVLHRAPIRYDLRDDSWTELPPIPAGVSLRERNLEITEPHIRKIHSDTIIEVTPDGKTVWEWDIHRHLDLKSCGRPQKCKTIDDEKWRKLPRDWTHTNTVRALPENKWFDAGDTRFRPGNVILTIRSWWKSFIVDRETKEVVWEFRGDYKKGLIKPHEAHMIEKGLPGAGNILIFDNGEKGMRHSSIALEIDPVTEEVVWKYDNGKKFFTPGQGSLQRLANGNTLISEDVRGRVFEVSPVGKIVWTMRLDTRVNRVHRYPREYCPNFS